MRRAFLVIALLLIIPTLLFSQRRNRYKWEFVGSIGFDDLFSDLGGSPQVGSHGLIGVKDWNLDATRPCFSAGVRYKNSKHFAFKSSLAFAWLYADDALSQNPIRNNRNLNVRTPVVELSAQVEYFPLKEKQSRLYRVKRAVGKRKAITQLQPYFFAGIGAFWFNPQGRDPGLNGAWVDLRPLHTEGEGLPGGPKQYSTFAVSAPLGIGFKYPINRQLSVGMEISIHLTTSDYIDDASGKYYDPNLFKLNESPSLAPQSIRLADPSLDHNLGGNSAPGQERANPSSKDAIMYTMFNLNYKIYTKRRTRTKF